MRRLAIALILFQLIGCTQQPTITTNQNENENELELRELKARIETGRREREYYQTLSYLSW